MLASLLETMEQRFLSEGGLKESMYKARVEWRKANLGENIVVTDEDGKPVIVKAEDYIKQSIK